MDVIEIAGDEEQVEIPYEHNDEENSIKKYENPNDYKKKVICDQEEQDNMNGDKSKSKRERSGRRQAQGKDKEEKEHAFVTYAKTGIRWVQYLISFLLLIFCIIIVMTGTQKGKLIEGPGGIVLFWVLICYLGCIEGGQNALVGLQHHDPSACEKTHRHTALTTKLIHLNSGYLEKFIIGRQLITVIVVFALNGVGGIHEGCSTLIPLPSALAAIFCSSNIALIIVTILLGQVSCQIVSTRYMLDFINNIFFTFTVYLSLLIETSGILHTVHFASGLFESLSNVTKNETKEVDLVTRILYWGRVAVSFLFLGFSLGTIIHEILLHHTSMWSGVPPGVSIAIFFLILIYVGILEGLQIAIFAVSTMDMSSAVPVNIPTQEATNGNGNNGEVDLENNNNSPTPTALPTATPTQLVPISKTAKKNCDLVLGKKSFASFVVGRQICVTLLMFVVARISTIDSSHPDFKDGYTTFGVSSSFQNFINTGMLGAFVTTILGSLIFRVIASQYPMEFLSNPVVYPVLKICLMLESTGIMRFSNAMAKIIRFCMRLHSDEYYQQETVSEPSVEEEQPTPARSNPGRSYDIVATASPGDVVLDGEE